MVKKNKKLISEYDININELEYIKRKKFVTSSLTLQIKGTDVDSSLVNTLRRVIINEIPSYAFPKKLIKIEKNNTNNITNSDYIKSEFSNLPIFDIDTDLYFLDKQYYINYNDPDRPKHPDEKSIDFYINEHNTNAITKHITTNNCSIFIDGEQIYDMYKSIEPIFLLDLKENEEFSCHMKATLGIGDVNHIWTPANCFFEYGNDDELKEDNSNYDDVFDDSDIKLTIESNGQIGEYNLLIKACDWIIKKNIDMRDFILTNFKNEIETKEAILEFEEDHTFGDMINNMLQKSENVIYSGIKKMDPMSKRIQIKIQTHETLIINELIKVFDKLKEIYLLFKEQFVNLKH